MRKCQECGEEKELKKFVKSEVYKGKQYYRHKCKECLNKTLRTGKPNAGRFQKGCQNWKGRKHSEESKRKMSEAQKGRKQSQQEKDKRAATHRKRGKSRQSQNYENWKMAILERDKYKCIKCGYEKNLHCDHIIPWKDDKKLRFDVSNGQTLCASCHLRKGKEAKEIDGTSTQFQKGITPWNKGLKHTEESRKKMSQSLKGRKAWNKGLKNGTRLRKSINQ